MKLFQSFFLGILGALGALVLEIIFLPFSLNTEIISEEVTSLNYFFFLAILIEEFLKYIIILKTISRFSKSTNIILNSIIFGFGFSVLEITSIYWNYRNGGFFDPLALLGIILLHASTAAIIGYVIFKSTQKKILGSILGLFLAFAIHSAYNLLRISENVYQEQLITAFLFFVLILDIFLLVILKKPANEENFD